MSLRAVYATGEPEPISCPNSPVYVMVDEYGVLFRNYYPSCIQLIQAIL
jgi:hypothetical protein